MCREYYRVQPNIKLCKCLLGIGEIDDEKKQRARNKEYQTGTKC